MGEQFYGVNDFIEAARGRSLKELSDLDVLTWNEETKVLHLPSVGDFKIEGGKASPETVGLLLYLEYLEGELANSVEAEERKRLFEEAKKELKVELPPRVGDEKPRKKGASEEPRTEEQARPTPKAQDEDSEWTSVPVDKVVVVEEEEVRQQLDPETIESLKRSISLHGLINPIEVRATENGRYVVLTGQRRYLAVKDLGWKDVPARVFRREIDAVARVGRQITENKEREPLDPVDEARGLLELKKAGVKQKEIADRLGMSAAWVSQMLKINLLSDEEVALARELGCANQAFLIALADLDEDTRLVALTALSETGGRSVADLHRVVEEFRGGSEEETTTVDKEEGLNEDEEEVSGADETWEELEEEVEKELNKGKDEVEQLYTLASIVETLVRADNGVRSDSFQALRPEDPLYERAVDAATVLKGSLENWLSSR